MNRLPILLTTLILLLPSAGWAEPAAGRFKAEQVCELYQSKRKLTNPGNFKTEPQRVYEIVEVLGGDFSAPHWLLIRTDAAPVPTRWVKGSCGIASVEPKADKPSPAATGCDTPGQYDSHVLAISWQPAFCELKGGGKPECRTLKPGRFDAQHFTLHGLWPNKLACGTGYGRCGVVKSKVPNFCDYPALPLTDSVRERLGVVMPSARYGSCLQRHEWWKHGTCRDTDPNLYFELAMTLLEQVNSSAFVQQFIAVNLGKTVTRQAFDAAFDSSFGPGASQRLRLSCARGKLTELQIALPKELPADARFAELLARASANERGSCGRRFELDLADR